ncbi:cytochrome P450 [Croceicoccus ponticola]|uniref:Cytochrome P450 n=1 Tax=Croceicoccus ponticola TaxID=2217664 RepID=A0A437GUM9_9SPHN|nr:cytochrome P450 [Croceicoccus ponticola]RVQ65165.1 cytochrome P450 [Croceicoccus ponticola]
MASNAVARPDHVQPSSVVEFDIYAPPGGKDDFHRAWQKVRQADTPDLVWSGQNGGHWIPLRNAVIREILADPARFGNTASILPKTAYGEQGLIPVTLDPPEHGPYRELLRASLSPRAVRDSEDAIRAISVGLIEAVKSQRHCDFVADYATLFPVRVFMKIALLDPDDAIMLRGWTDHMLRPDPDADWGDDVSGWRRGIRLFRAYLEPIIKARRGGTGDDILSRIVNGTIEGDPIPPDDALQMSVLVLLAGLDTVVNFLGFAMEHLAQSPRLQTTLASDPAIIPRAVEELVRRFPVVTMAREVMEDCEFRGSVLKRGDMIAIPTPLGGLDPMANACPMDVDPGRRAREHVTFGNGPHRCPGAFLARAEIRITLEEWMSRIPNFGLAPGIKVRHVPGGVAGVESLPLVWPG